MKIKVRTVTPQDPNGVADMLARPMAERLALLNALQANIRVLAGQPWPPTLDYRTARYTTKEPVQPLPDAVFEALLQLPVGAPLPDEYIPYFVTDGPAYTQTISE